MDKQEVVNSLYCSERGRRCKNSDGLWGREGSESGPGKVHAEKMEQKPPSNWSMTSNSFTSFY